jgi:hypothetical protein
LNENQFGFLKKSSTSSAAASLVDEIVKRINNKRQTVALFLDLKNAFDCLDYRVMKDILFGLGLRGNVLKLFENYLSNRRQFVAIENERSNLLNVTQGIPQGSILGPLLFLIYVNDIFLLGLNCHIQLSHPIVTMQLWSMTLTVIPN